MKPGQYIMSSPHTQKHWLDQGRNIKRLWSGFIVVLALIVLAEPLLELHPHFSVEGLFGFHAWYGFLVCAALIVFAKAVALLLKRPDSYYGGKDD